MKNHIAYSELKSYLIESLRADNKPKKRITERTFYFRKGPLSESNKCLYKEGFGSWWEDKMADLGEAMYNAKPGVFDKAVEIQDKGEGSVMMGMFNMFKDWAAPALKWIKVGGIASIAVAGVVGLCSLTKTIADVVISVRKNNELTREQNATTFDVTFADKNKMKDFIDYSKRGDLEKYIHVENIDFKENTASVSCDEKLVKDHWDEFTEELEKVSA